MILEKQTHFIIQKADGKMDALSIKNDCEKHDNCNVDHETKVGDKIFWHKCDMYMTKVEGTVIAKRSNDWDWTLAMGHRAVNIVETENYPALLKEYRSQHQRK